MSRHQVYWHSISANRGICLFDLLNCILSVISMLVVESCYPPALSNPTEQVTKELEQLAASIGADISRVGDEAV